MSSGNAKTTRTESDLLGDREVPAEVYWGIHTARALENFPLSGRRVHPELIRAMLVVKSACARTNHRLGFLADDVADAIIGACQDIADGPLFDQIVVDALQGGAGTSLNMNVNEVIANRAEERLGGHLGQYAKVHPNDHVNLHQSTNDTFPTALRIAAIRLLHRLEKAIAALQTAFQDKERVYSGVVKVARTELQDACPISYGAVFSAWAEALSRDRWRVFKSEERLRVVNLGGTAVGTAIAAPRDYVFSVVDTLRAATGLGLARAENLVDATQNVDGFVEVSGIVKAHAVNLFKISSDLRLLSSGPGRSGRDRVAPGAGRLVDHAGQGQPGDLRGGRASGDEGDRPRRRRHHGRPVGTTRTQRLPAVAGRRPARLLEPSGSGLRHFPHPVRRGPRRR
jgi:aspartate ammonia-lyase